jgi:DNA-binding transcriptional regulator GbsR (MarR family)
VKPAEEKFIEDLGQHMMSWGLSRTTGRVYALLLVSADAIGLEEISQTLDVAKSGASVSARQLVSMGLARASGERGSRRVRYEALYTLESIFAARTAGINELLERLREGSAVASSKRARRQMAGMSQDLETWVAMAAETMHRTAKAKAGRQ